MCEHAQSTQAIDMKISFQNLIFPDGLTTTKEKLGTSKNSWLFIDFAPQDAQESKMVHPTISDWNRFEEWINRTSELIQFADMAGIPPGSEDNSVSLQTTVRDLNQGQLGQRKF